MAHKYLEVAITPAVAKAQAHYFGASMDTAGAPSHDPLGSDEQQFIAARDSFYMASVSETGWPYLQHRGGAPGFLRVLSPTSLGFADYKGNRQMLSTGNLSVNDRVALFLMDYPQRTRLKIMGHAKIADAREHPEIVAQLANPQEARIVERLYFIEVLSYDWNCPKYITPRYTAAQVQEAVAPLQARIAELELALKALQPS